jgi:hypothetical protein
MFIRWHKPTDFEGKSTTANDKRLYRHQHGTVNPFFGPVKQRLMPSKTPRHEKRMSQYFFHCLVVVCLITRSTVDKVTRDDLSDGIGQDHNLPKPLQSLSVQPIQTKSIQNEPSHQETTKNKRPNDITKTMESVANATRNDYVSFRSDEKHVHSFEQAFHTMMLNNQRIITISSQSLHNQD